MKRIFSVIWLCIIFLPMVATNTFSLSTSSGRPNELVTITASLSCIDSPTAVEMILPLGVNLQYVENSATLNVSRSNEHIISAIQADDTLYVQIFSMTLQPIIGETGELFTFQLKLNSEPQVYSLCPSVVMSSVDGTAIGVTAQGGILTTIAPKIEILTSSINYGHQPIRQTYTQNIRLKNVGTEEMVVSSLVMPSEQFSYDGYPHTLAPGKEESIAITYQPIQRGKYSGILYVNSNATNASLRVNSQIKVEADPFSVNELHVGSASGISDDTVTISIRVNNMEPLTAVQFSIKLPTGLEYINRSAQLSNRASTHSLVTNIEEGVLKVIIFSISNDTVANFDGEIMTFRLKLDGTNGTYILQPTEVVLSNRTSENMTSDSYSGSITIEAPKYSGANSLVFADSPVTEQSEAKYSIYNSSDQPLTISGVTFVDGNEEFIIMDSLPMVIPNRETRELTVVHTPNMEGDFFAIMQVYNNDPLDRMHSVVISGYVYEPNTLSLWGEQMNDGYMLHIALDNYTDIVALQMDVKWLPDFEVEIIKSDRAAAQTSSLTTLDDGTYRITSFSMLNQPITGHSGEVFSVLFKGKDVAEYYRSTISLDSVVISDISSTQRLTASLPILDVHIAYTITVNTSDERMGIVSGGGEFEYGTEVEIVAIANPEYTFLQWDDGVIDNLRTITVTANATYTALFQEGQAQAMTNNYQFDSKNAVKIIDQHQHLRIIRDGKIYTITGIIL